ncbi:hypothetical protein BVX94_03865, partial [bacterium B17]
MPVTTGDYPTETSTKDLIDVAIRDFYDDYYNEQDINFRIKAYLHSEGDYQIQVDEVEVVGAEGRIVITEPDTWNTNDNAWILGVTNVVRWNTTGNVTDQLHIQFSTNSGANWETIGTNVVNDGEYEWLTPGSIAAHERDNCRMRMEDMSAMANGSIWDESNGNFETRWRYHILSPNGGEKWYTGDTNNIVWASAPGLGANSWLWFSQDSGTNWTRFPGDVPNTVGSTNNIYPWNTPKTNENYLSENARLAITVQGGNPSILPSDASDNDFILAGLRMTQPSGSTIWKRGNTEILQWVSSGAGAGGVKIELSLDAGTNYVTVTNDAPNNPGLNSLSWPVQAADPSDRAIFRITANGDANVWGNSEIFTLADVDIKDPGLGAEWQIGSTNIITWTYGGPVSDVNIYYSADGVSTNPADWTLLPGGGSVANALFPTTNTFEWVVPSDPSDNAYIRIAAIVGGETLWAASERFNIAGVRIDTPNEDVGGIPARTLGVEENITWTYAAAGPSAGGEIRWSNDGDIA